MNNGIANANGAKVLLKSDGNTSDIIKAVLAAVPEVRKQTAGFSRQFTPDRDGLRELWRFVKNEIHYNEDPLGVQWIREPARLWHDKEGDCKSFTVFIVSVLENLGIRFFIRFVNTEKRNSRTVNHVYPVAILANGERVVLDAVYTRFDAEHSYFYKKDYAMADIYRLSGIGNTDQAEIEKYWAEIKKIDSEIPDDIIVLGGDITTMQRGEFERFQQGQFFEAQAETATNEDDKMRFSAAADAVRTGSIAGLRGIGNYSPSDVRKIDNFLKATSSKNMPAFSAPILALPDNLSGLGSLGDKIKDLAKDVLNVWKKVLNWMFKTAMPLAAPYFLYTFIKKNVGKKTDAKRLKQTNLMNFITKVGKFDSPQDVINAVKTGIVKKFGKNPEQVIADGAAGKIAGIGVVVTAIITAVTSVVAIVEKIVSVFKKKKTDAPEASTAYAPDFDELSSELSMTPGTGTSITTGAPDKGGGVMSQAIPLLAAAAVGIYILTNQ